MAGIVLGPYVEGLIYRYEDSVGISRDDSVIARCEQIVGRGEWGVENATTFLNAYATQKCRAYLRFGHEVDEVLRGDYFRYDVLKVCDTPKVFLRAGLDDKPMSYTQKHLRYAIKDKKLGDNFHGFTVEKIKRLPEVMQNPILIADSPSRHDALIAVLPLTDDDGFPVITAIHPNGKARYHKNFIETNAILSVYGKDDFSLYFRERVPARSVVYINDKRLKNSERYARVQFPEAYSNLEPNIILKRPRCLVNDACESEGENQIDG